MKTASELRKHRYQCRQGVRKALERKGVRIRQWADQRGFDVRVAYGVLSGRLAGSSGEAKKIAIALGIDAEAEPNREPEQIQLELKSRSGQHPIDEVLPVSAPLVLLPEIAKLLGLG